MIYDFILSQLDYALNFILFGHLKITNNVLQLKL